MSKARVIGAGSAGSSLYGSNANGKSTGTKFSLPYSLDGALINHRLLVNKFCKIKCNDTRIVPRFTMF
jgi:hypothetical protein